MKILVIGGSSGLGLATIKLLEENHTIISVAPSAVKGIENYKLDLSSNESIHSVTDRILTAHPDIDCVIFSAGLYQSDESINISFEEIDTIFSVNTTGIMKFTNKMLPLLEKNKGLLIFVGSVNVYKRNHLAYTPSKCALQAYAEYLQNTKSAVRITMLNPGLMDTQLFEHAGARRDKSDSMKPEDIAQVIEQVVENKNIELSEIVIQAKK